MDSPKSKLENERRVADLNAAYARHNGRLGPEAGRQEELLRDARAWARATFKENLPAARDVQDLKEQIVKRTWDHFVHGHRHYTDFQLGYREFGSALWVEGWPSLEDLASEAIQERAASSGSEAGAAGTRSSNERQEVVGLTPLAAIRLGESLRERMLEVPETTTAMQHRPSLEAVVKDEQRREKAKRDLVGALQSYINKLEVPVKSLLGDATKVTEIFCSYARENYASRAAKTLEGIPPIDPRLLFEAGDLTELRDLCGLPTIGDVLALAGEGVRVEGLNFENGSLKWLLLEEPWSNWFRSQIRDCVNECVRAKREEYEQRHPALPTEASPPASRTLRK